LLCMSAMRLGLLYVAPFLDRGHEAPLDQLIDVLGADHVVFGSDWPHGEGVAEPMDFAKELSGFTGAEVHRIMRDNCLELLGASLG